MKSLFATFAVMLLGTNNVLAQCGQTRTFVTNKYQNSSVAVSNIGYPDVTAIGGIVLVPAQVRGSYNHNAAVIVPQSTFFFAASNPNVFEFRIREFLQVPGTDQIITTDGFGNDLIINAGVRDGSIVNSRGSLLYRQ